MKTTLQLLKNRWTRALACALAPIFLATTAIAADDTNAELARPSTNAADASSVQPAKHRVSISIGESEYARYPLPKEVLDRLTPEQVLELEKSRREHSQIEEVVIPLAAFVMVVGIIALGVTQRLKRARILHETIRIMIEKGQPIPPELLQPQEPRRGPRSDLRRGLVFIGIGIALLFMFFGHGDGMLRWVGLIPLLMGVAFLITWKVESNKNGQAK
jgi:hypothetical protein